MQNLLCKYSAEIFKYIAVFLFCLYIGCSPWGGCNFWDNPNMCWSHVKILNAFQNWGEGCCGIPRPIWSKLCRMLETTHRYSHAWKKCYAFWTPFWLVHVYPMHLLCSACLQWFHVIYAPYYPILRHSVFYMRHCKYKCKYTGICIYHMMCLFSITVSFNSYSVCTLARSIPQSQAACLEIQQRCCSDGTKSHCFMDL